MVAAIFVTCACLPFAQAGSAQVIAGAGDGRASVGMAAIGCGCAGLVIGPAVSHAVASDACVPLPNT